MSGELRAVSHLVAADLVYRPREGMAVYVVDVKRGRVCCDVYAGTSRGERIWLARAAFNALFTNYSYKGETGEDSRRDSARARGAAGAGAPGGPGVVLDRGSR